MFYYEYHYTTYHFHHEKKYYTIEYQFFYSHWIGLQENLQEKNIFNAKNHDFL